MWPETMSFLNMTLIIRLTALTEAAACGYIPGCCFFGGKENV